MIICLCVWVSTFFLCFLKTAAAQKILSGFRVWWFLLVSHGKQAAKIAGENIVCNVAEEWNPQRRWWFEATCRRNSHEEVQGNYVLPNNGVAGCSLEEEDGEHHDHTIRGNISTKTGVECWSLWGYLCKAYKYQHFARICNALMRVFVFMEFIFIELLISLTFDLSISKFC